MIYGSVCSGIEAASVAWEPLGWKPAFFAEIDRFPSAVLAHRWPGVKNLGDFTQIGESAGPIDLLVGGPNCQPYSVAGRRGGLDDCRGNLIFDFLQLAGRLRPSWLAFENVPGLLSIDGGRTFGAFLGEMARLGYGFAYRILDAQHFGLAMSRRRLFVVGHLGDWRYPAAALSERSSLSNDQERNQAVESAALGVDRSTSAGRAIAFTDRKRLGGRNTEWRVELAYSPLVRRRGGSRTARQIVTPQLELRCLTPRETERLLGFPDDWTLVPCGAGLMPDTYRNQCLGNSMAVPVMAWIGRRIEFVRNLQG